VSICGSAARLSGSEDAPGRTRGSSRLALRVLCRERLRRSDVDATNRAYFEATETDDSVSGVSATHATERGNAALREARTLARYTGKDEELTKPSVVLLDWVGDDEVTVRWDTARGELADETSLQALEDGSEDFAPKRFRGIGPRTGGVLLGIVLGAAVVIGVLAIFAPRGTDPSFDPTVQAAVDPGR
jgi:hypothetical protein